MFEFYRELSAIGKLIFYFAILIVLCSVIYQCQACKMIPLQLKWREAYGNEQFEDPSSLGSAFLSVNEVSGVPRRLRTRDTLRDYQGLQQQLNQLRTKIESYKKANPEKIQRLQQRKRTLPQLSGRRLGYGQTVQGSKMNRKRPAFAGAKIILFYAPWCGHCQKFKPVWKKFEKIMSDKLKTVSVNGDENRQMLEEYNVDKFPTVILENRNGRKEYDGDMTLEGLKMFVSKENGGPNTREVLLM